MSKMKSKGSVASMYDSASADQGSGGPSSFADDYNSASAQGAGDGGEQEPQQDPDQDAAQDSPSDLDIPAEDVSKMQALKDKGDMAGLGQYVSQFLN